jgi:hypothetical protein
VVLSNLAPAGRRDADTVSGKSPGSHAVTRNFTRSRPIEVRFDGAARDGVVRESMLIVVWTELVFRVAVIVTAPARACGLAVATNVTAVCPVRIVTLFGVVRFEELESRMATSASAAPFNVNSHWVDCPGSILRGVQVSKDNKTGDTVTTVFRVDAP